ncbi:MAG: phage tail family protein [Clostridia bacterium]|nr:phage tail family protein [Clostridia bacterium]
MRYNGVDIRTVHPAISVNKEIYPGAARREVVTVRGNRREIYAGHRSEQSEAVIRVNIAGRTRDEAYEVRALLAAWAASSGEATAMLEPTHWQGKAYEAVLSEISEPEYIFGHTTVDVVFALPDGRAYDLAESMASGEGGVNMMIGGSDKATLIITQIMSGATSGLTWTMDGERILKLKSSYKAASGAKIVADFASGSLTADGTHIEAQIDYTASTWQPRTTPGEHALTSNNAGTIEARWRNRWI